MFFTEPLDRHANAGDVAEFLVVTAGIAASTISVSSSISTFLGDYLKKCFRSLFRIDIEFFVLFYRTRCQNTNPPIDMAGLWHYGSPI